MPRKACGDDDARRSYHTSRPAAFSRIGFDETTDLAVESRIDTRDGGPRELAEAFSEGSQAMVNSVLERFGGDIVNADEFAISEIGFDQGKLEARISLWDEDFARLEYVAPLPKGAEEPESPLADGYFVDRTFPEHPENGGYTSPLFMPVWMINGPKVIYPFSRAPMQRWQLSTNLSTEKYLQSHLNNEIP